MPSTVRRLRRRLAGVMFPLLRAIGWVRDVLALAIVSLALSIALWLMITNEQNPPTDRSITVPVELGNAPVNLVAYNSPVGPVSVTVNAPFDIVQRVSIDTVTDRKSTRLNSSHANISYAVFCLKKKKICHPIKL